MDHIYTPFVQALPRRMYMTWLVTLLLAASAPVQAQTSYSWAAYPTRCTGVGVYTQPNMTVGITGSGYSNRGPQAAASSCASTSGARYFSPKYVTSPNASAPDWQHTGLGVGVDWTNLSSGVSVDITFTSPICTPVTFTIYDINSDGSSFPWRDRVSVYTTNFFGAPSFPTATGMAGGTTYDPSTGIFTTPVSTGGNLNSAVNVTFSTGTLSNLRIFYESMPTLAGGVTDPDPEYIIISNITSTTCVVLPVTVENLVMNCGDGKPQLKWTASGDTYEGHFTVFRSADGEHYEPVGEIGLSEAPDGHSFEWSDPAGAGREFYYQIGFTDADGKSDVLPQTLRAQACGEPNFWTCTPNPAQGSLHSTLYVDAPGTFFLEITDMQGRQVLSENRDFGGAGAWKLETPLDGLAPGLYLVKARLGAAQVTERLLIR